MVHRSTASPGKLHIATPLPVAAEPSSTWLNVVSHVDPRYGGLSAVVPELCGAVATNSSVAVRLAAFCRADEAFTSGSFAGVPTSYWPAGRIDWWRDRSLPRRFSQQVDQADGLHLHGLWEQSTQLGAQMARSQGKPYVLSAHGMLDPWALRNKRWKKRAYAALYEHSNVRGAACLHALTVAEAEDYRRFGGRGPIAVIPNGVRVPEGTGPDRFLDRFPELRGRTIVLFLARLHRKKGLDILVEAWAAVEKRWPEAHLVLAGPDFDGTRQRVANRIKEFGVTDRVTFTGMLERDLKWSALATATCFVLPSYSEGLSTSVLEAMAIGIPVIVTKECHIPEVSRYDAGWEIDSNVDELSTSLENCLDAPTEFRQRCGENGKLLVAERYSWESVAARMSTVYGWLAGGALPQAVDLMVA